MAKSKTPPRKPARRLSSQAGGTYVYDKELGKVVKVSDRIPGVSGRGRRKGASAEGVGPCGRQACGGGRCAP